MTELSSDQNTNNKRVTVLPHKHKSLAKVMLGLSAILGWTLCLVLLTTSSNSVVYKDQLSPEMAYNYTRNTVWFHSEGKVRELRSILSQHDVRDSSEVGKIKSLIKSMLIRRTESIPNS